MVLYGERLFLNKERLVSVIGALKKKQAILFFYYKKSRNIFYSILDKSFPAFLPPISSKQFFELLLNRRR